MKMREMDLIGRITLTTEIGSMHRHAHMIEAYINTGQETDGNTVIGQMLTFHESHLTDCLAKIASMLGLALVDKAVLVEGEVQP